MSGLCAGLAGMLAAAEIKEADVAGSGLFLELDAILAVVLGGGLLTGGRPHVLGAVLGALVIQTLTVMLQMRGVATEHGLVIKAAVALAICLPQAPKLASRVRRLAGAQR
jgi:ribose/xylose/arabinose/galactoside ABC-type transport system permease subunit